MTIDPGRQGPCRLPKRQMKPIVGLSDAMMKLGLSGVSSCDTDAYVQIG